MVEKNITPGATGVEPGYESPVLGWLKLETDKLREECKQLPVAIQEYISKPDFPVYEFVLVSVLPFFVVKQRTYSIKGIPQSQASDNSNNVTLVAAIANMNSQSKGTVHIQSADPSQPPMIDSNLLSYLYDRRVMIEAVQEMIK